MKSLLAGIMAVGAFSVSFAATLETKVQDTLSQPAAASAPARMQKAKPAPATVQTKPTEKPVYNLIGTKPVAEAAPVAPPKPEAKPLADNEADSLLVVSQPDSVCTPCATQRQIVEKLKKNGYKAKDVLTGEYSGPESVSRTPTLLFFNGKKMIKKSVGVMGYDSIVKILKKPIVAVTK